MQLQYDQINQNVPILQINSSKLDNSSFQSEINFSKQIDTSILPQIQVNESSVVNNNSIVKMSKSSLREILLPPLYKVGQKARSASPEPVSQEIKKQFTFFKPFTKVFSPERDEDDDSQYVLKKIIVPRGYRFQVGISEKQKRQHALYKDAKQSCQSNESLTTRSKYKNQVQYEVDQETEIPINPRIACAIKEQNKRKFKMIHTKKYYAIVEQLDPETQMIDLSNVNVTRDMVERILEEIEIKNIKLRRLIAEKCFLQNELAFFLISEVKYYGSLKCLDLSMNRIGDDGVINIASIIPKLHLQELYLHWNLISSRGGLVVLKEVLECYQLKVLDLSCNQIGNTNCQQFVDTLCDFFVENVSEGLTHIDISFNGFSEDKIDQFRQNLILNHTIYGLHLAGDHDYFMNSLGFIEKRENICSEGKFLTRYLDKINGVKPNKQSRLHLKNDKEFSFQLLNRLDTCWICEGWQQVEFEIPSKILGNTKSLFLHIDFLNYEPLLVEKDKFQDAYNITIMCPPASSLLFCFVSSGNQIFLSPLYPTVILSQHTNIKACTQKNLKIKEFNNLRTSQPNDVFTVDFNPRVSVKPRAILISKKLDEQLSSEAWDVRSSVFQNYLIDYQSHLQKCFNSDILKISDKINQEMLNLLWSYYQPIYFSYLHLLTMGTQKNNLSVDQETLNDYFRVGSIIGDNSLSFQQFNRIKKEVLEKSNFERYKYIQLIIRCSEELYIKQKSVQTSEEAIHELFINGFLNSLKRIEFSKNFKEIIFWTEDFSKLVQSYENVMLAFIKKSLRKPSTLKAKKEGINFEDFVIITQNIQNLVNNYITWDPIELNELKKHFYYTLLDRLLQEQSNQQIDQVKQPNHQEENNFVLDNILLFEALGRLTSSLKVESDIYQNLVTNLNKFKQLSIPKLATQTSRLKGLLSSKKLDDPTSTLKRTATAFLLTDQKTTRKKSLQIIMGDRIDAKVKLELVIWIIFYKMEDISSSVTIPQKFLFLNKLQ